MNDTVQRLAAEPNLQQPPADSNALPFSGPVDVRSVMLTGIFLMLLFYTLYFAAPVIVPVVLAILLNLLLAPLVRLLAKLWLPQPVGAAIVLITVVGVLVGAVSLLANPAKEWIRAAPENFGKIEEKLRTLHQPLKQIEQATEQIEQATEQLSGEAKPAPKVQIATPSMTRTLLSGTQEVLAGIGVVIVLLYMLLASGDSFRRKVVSVLPTLQDKKRALEIMHGIERDISHYLVTMTLINLGLGACVALVLHLLGVPNPVLWGAMVALLNYAPYVGNLVSLVILGVVGLLSFNSLAQGLLVPGSVAVLMLLEGEIITPTIVGHRLELSPIAVFLAMLLWGWLWGITGALIAVPVLVSFKIVCEKLEPLQPIATFLAP